MKQGSFIVTIILLVLSFTCGALYSQESEAEVSTPWSGGLELSTTNNYLWRGMTVNEGFILQPDAWISYHNFTLDLWSSFTLNEPKDDIRRPEIDAILSYETAFMNVSIIPSFNYYHYINQDDATDTGELGCSIGYPIGILTLGATVFVDVMEYSGATYLEESVELEKEISDQVSFTSGLRLGSGLKKFNESYFGLSKSTVSLLSLDASVTYCLENGLYVQPAVQYNKTISSDLESYMDKHTTVMKLLIGMEF